MISVPEIAKKAAIPKKTEGKETDKLVQRDPTIGKVP